MQGLKLNHVGKQAAIGCREKKSPGLALAGYVWDSFPQESAPY